MVTGEFSTALIGSTHKSNKFIKFNEVEQKEMVTMKIMYSFERMMKW